jgi:SAM-dependent methyltransferase
VKVWSLLLKVKLKISYIINHKLPPSVSNPIKNTYHFLCGYSVHWARVISDKETARYITSLDYKTFKALEISGSKWKEFGFASYRSANYPEYDLCNGVLDNEKFDIIIVEHVLEHVLKPYCAVQNLYRMLNSGGVAVIITPFLIRVHAYPTDCSRWTELGIRHLLIAGGFNCDNIKTGSWGNRACVIANFKKWAHWVSWKHSLKNEPGFCVAVWAFARK